MTKTATKKRKRTIKEYVEAILRKYEATRNDDKLLQVIYWKKVDKIDFNNFMSEFVAKGTPSESITRARRIIQEEGRYLPTDDVMAGRKGKEMSMRRSIINKREVV